MSEPEEKHDEPTYICCECGKDSGWVSEDIERWCWDCVIEHLLGETDARAEEYGDAYDLAYEPIDALQVTLERHRKSPPSMDLMRSLEQMLGDTINAWAALDRQMSPYERRTFAGPKK